MPNISVLKNSKFLTKADVDQPSLLTITSCTEVNVAKEGAPEEYKWALHFKESDKPLILNSTKGQIIAGFIGNDNTDNWVGHKVVLYHDPNIQFAGKLIGGIGVRAPRTPQARPVPAPAPQQPAPVAGQPWPSVIKPVPANDPAGLPPAEDDNVPF